MSAGKEISVEHSPIPKLAIIAGSGTLPRDLYQRAIAMGIECHVIGFKGHTNYIAPDFWGSIGRASQIIHYLQTHKIEHLTFIGGIDKPSFKTLRPDWVTLKFFLTTWVKSFGDSNVLTSARNQLEKIGFQLHGVHEFLPELLMPTGILGAVEIHNAPHDDVILGINEALDWGSKDKGQAVIVHNGQIIARENKRGTNYMIKHYGVADSILVKMCKPQQDIDMDLPTIGPNTVQLCADHSMAGIIGHAGNMLIAEQDKAITLADQNNLFILGHTLHAE